MLRQALTWGLTAAVVWFFVGQCRKPSWWLGRAIARAMNANHSGVTDWGLAQVAVASRFTVLDVGCGGGRTVQKLAAMASAGSVYGLDYSSASLATARQTNRQLIADGRVVLARGTVSQLPFPSTVFDVVTAVETHYYWPNFEADLREIARVLKPGGRLVIIAETYKGQRFGALFRPAMKLLRARYLSLAEHRDAFGAAGFTDVAVSSEPSGWICAVGTKPAAA